MTTEEKKNFTVMVILGETPQFFWQTVEAELKKKSFLFSLIEDNSL
jgi:hypothetical protein